MYFLPTILQIQIASHQKEVFDWDIINFTTAQCCHKTEAHLPCTCVHNKPVQQCHLMEGNCGLATSKYPPSKSGQFHQLYLLVSTWQIEKFKILTNTNIVEHKVLYHVCIIPNIYRQPVQNAFEKENCPNWLFLYLYCSFKLGKQLEWYISTNIIVQQHFLYLKVWKPRLDIFV